MAAVSVEPADLPQICHDLDLNCELPDYIFQIATKQGENVNTKLLAITELRDMIFEKGEFLPHKTDDEYLTKFLRARYWKVVHAYKLLHSYYEFRENKREYHEKVNPLELKALGDDDIVNVAPYKDDSGRRIITYRFGNWTPSKVPIDDIFKATVLLLEIGSLEPVSQVMGGIGIFDMKGLSWSQVLYMTPSVAQTMISLMVTSMPLRTHCIHIVNQNWAFRAAFNIIKPFLSSRMRECIFIHGSDMSSLHKHIRPQFLSKRYGGRHDDYPYELWLDSLKINEPVIRELEQLGYVFEENNKK